MSEAIELHDAVRRGDLQRLRELLSRDPGLVNARSETDARGTYPLHVAAEFGQAGAAQVLLQYGADLTLLDAENDAIFLSWAAFFGRPEVVAILLEAGSEPNQRNKHDSRRSVVAWAGRKGNGNLSPTPHWQTGAGQPR